MNYQSNLKKKPITQYDIYTCLLLFFITLAVYWQVNDFEFISFDDPLYVTENRHVNTGLTKKNIAQAFRFSQKGDLTYYHPITMLSHMIDCQLFGISNGAHHLSNLLIHLINTLLLFFVLKLMTGQRWQSAFVASLFALHPFNVDTVAWISERKNLLSTFFWFLTLLAYIFYIIKKSIFKYMTIFFCMLLGLMAKPMLVTLPCVLLLLDLWPLGRVRYNNNKPDNMDAENFTPSPPLPMNRRFYRPFRLLLVNAHLLTEKIPLFLLSALWVYIASISNRYLGFFISTEVTPMDLRIANALVSYMKYLGKMLWPFNLAVFYPYPDKMLPAWQIAGAAFVLVLISFLIFQRWDKRPWLTVGWLWYVGTLVPVIGIIQNGLWPSIADRWTYVPLIGIYIIIAWEGAFFFKGRPLKKLLLSLLTIAFITFFMMTTWVQLRHWKNNITLYRHALEVTKNNYLAHNNLGLALEKKNGNNEICIKHYMESIKIKPTYVKAYFNLAYLFVDQKKLSAALDLGLKVIRIKPDFEGGHYILGKIMANQNNFIGAIPHLQKAIQLKPDFTAAHNDLGIALEKTGKLEEAIEHYNKALYFNPDYTVAHNNLGSALKKIGNISDSFKHLSIALQLNPDYAEAHNNIGNILEIQGKTEEAIRHYNAALRLKPDFAEVHNNLGATMIRNNRPDEAIRHYRKALEINPNIAAFHNNLGEALFHKGEIDEAINHYENALQIKSDIARIHKNIGDAFFHKGNIEKAILHYQKTIQLEPGYTNTEILLSKALQIQEQLSFFIRKNEKELLLDSKNPELLFKLGELYKQKGNREKAIFYYRKTLETQPDFVKALYSLAIIYDEKKDYDRSISTFKKMLEIHPENYKIYYNISCVYSKQDAPGKAIEWLKKAIDKGYKNWKLIKTDKDLENVRKDLSFKKLIDEFGDME